MFFSIGRALSDIKIGIVEFWKEADGKIHIDGWREVRSVDDFSIKVVNKEDVALAQKEKLFVINLGGYKQNEFEEFHYKFLAVSTDKGSAIAQAKQTAFYKHTGFKGAVSHIDDKYGIDVDDIYEIEDILPPHLKDRYSIQITKRDNLDEDELHLGYLKIDKL